MNLHDRLQADARHHEWKNYFQLKELAAADIAKQPALVDLKLFVEYITFLRGKYRPAVTFHLPSAAVGAALTILLISLLLGIFGFIFPAHSFPS